MQITILFYETCEIENPTQFDMNGKKINMKKYVQTKTQQACVTRNNK